MNDSRSAILAHLAPALFWGSVWGLWEATAGHAVHLLRVPGLAGAVMLPAAVLFMSRAFAATGRVETIFFAGCVAAGFKLLDLLIPGPNFLAVLNPAQFILLEALAVAGAQAAARSFAGRRRTAPLNMRDPGRTPAAGEGALAHTLAPAVTSDSPRGSTSAVPARQGTSLRLATRPWLLTTGEYGGKGPPGKPGTPAARGNKPRTSGEPKVRPLTLG